MTCIAAFDLDRTLLCVNSSFQFAHYLYKHKHFSISKLLWIHSLKVRHLSGMLSLRAVHESAFHHLFKGMPALLVKEWATQFVNESLDTLLYRPVFDKMLQAQAAGCCTAIFSSAPEFLVEPIAARLRCTLWHATQYAVDKDLHFCEISQLIQGREKAHLLRRLGASYGCQKQAVTAYSDSHHDLLFLLAAGHPVGVNPTFKLRSICRKKKWPIIE